MAFWIFMTIMCLLIPLIMLLTGIRFVKAPPKKINWVYGYRTGMSTKNMDTWVFAHHHCGRVWRVAGGVMLVVSAAVMLLLLGKDEDTIGIVSGALCLTQVVAMFGTIFPTEAALKKNFDRQGSRKG